MRLVIGLGDGPCSHRWFPLPCPWGLNERVCFSPQADGVGRLVICALGIDASPRLRQRREFIARWWIPLLLGAHQCIEALVWLWLKGHVPRGIARGALWAYL